MDDIIQNIRDQIAKGEIGKALIQLKKVVQEPERLSNVIMQESSLSDIKKDEIAGAISKEKAHELTNRVVQSTLEIILIWEKELKDNSIEKVSDKPKTKLIEEEVVREVGDGFKDSIRFYTWVALLPILTSLAFLIFFFINNQGIEILQALTSTLIASLSAFPVREIVNRKEKVSNLNALIKKIRFLKVNPIEKEIKRVNEIFWIIIERPFQNQ